MDRELIEMLLPHTQEEERLLCGEPLKMDTYTDRGAFIVEGKKFVPVRQMIALRPHTRFTDFPVHRHDFVEIMYMLCGETIHDMADGHTIHLKAGEVLLINRHCSHSIRRCGEKDVAVNFIVLPDFFTGILPEMGEEETPLRRFLVDSLCGDHVGSGYLHFEIADIRPLQNLVENLLVILMDDVPNRQRLSQMTMSLLFMQLVGYTETLRNDVQEDAAVLKALQYIETNYSSCSLEQLAMHLHYSEPWLSREIKNKTGKNFTQLVQEKRLSQAAFLLKHTDRNVSDISLAVGYENISYFHRLFALYYGKSPRNFRMQERTLF